MTFLNIRIASSLLFFALIAGKVVKAGNSLLKPDFHSNYYYRYHCEKETGPTGSDPRWPCFTFYHGDLKSAGIELLNYGNADINNVFLVKDDAQTGTFPPSP